MQKVIKSIFENFAADQSVVQFGNGEPLAMALSLFLHALFVECGHRTVNGEIKVWHLPRYDDWVVLAGERERLAKIGFENAETMNRTPFEIGGDDIVEFDDELVLEWALHGKKYTQDAKISERQLYALEALFAIDKAMTEANANGITIGLVETVALAAHWLSEAKECDLAASLLERGVNPDLIESAVKERKYRDSQLGGLAKSAKYEPLRTYARDLARKETYPSKRQAAKRMKPLVLKRAREIGWPLSEDNAERQIGEWLTGIPFGGKRSTDG